MNESWHKYEWVMAHISMSGVHHLLSLPMCSTHWYVCPMAQDGTHINEWCTHAWVTSHIWMSRGTCKWVLVDVWMSSAHMNDAWHGTYESYGWLMTWHIWIIWMTHDMTHMNHMDDSCIHPGRCMNDSFICATRMNSAHINDAWLGLPRGHAFMCVLSLIWMMHDPWEAQVMHHA